MFKIISNLLLLALFVSATAFTSGTSNSLAVKTVPSGKAAPLTMLTMNAFQPTAGLATIRVEWTSTIPNPGPFQVTVWDQTTGLLVTSFASTASPELISAGLTIGDTYRVSVGDGLTVIGKAVKLI